LSNFLDQRGWDFLHPHMNPERAKKIELYAARYFEPALTAFPELFGNVYLSLRKYGWLAEYKPVLHVVIRESALDTNSPSRIRATTAHELMHLIQFGNGIGLDRANSRNVERQATFLTFARGFAYDFLLTFIETCPKTECDHCFKFCYYDCKLLFKGCCKDLKEKELRMMADKLSELAKGYGLNDNPDYYIIVRNCLCAGFGD
jgi:hypothetical protein